MIGGINRLDGSMAEMLRVDGFGNAGACRRPRVCFSMEFGTSARAGGMRV